MLPHSESFYKIKTLDMHTGGEPLRIVLEGYPSFPGMKVLEVRRKLLEEHDHLRKSLMWEPRGHADMYGLVRIEAERDDSAFGVIFMHNEGYSTMCGHATIAIGKAAVDLGWVPVTPPLTSFKIDAPCGQLKVEVNHDEKGEVRDVSFENVSSFFIGNFLLNLPGLGQLSYDLAYGGAFYAYLDTKPLGISCIPEDYSEIVRLGKVIKKAVMEQNQHIYHPFEEDLSFLYGTIFIDEAEKEGIHSKNVCIFADGEVDRCATGSGVSGRAAIHHHRGEWKIGEVHEIESITGSSLKVEIVDEEAFGPYAAVKAKVSGKAYYTGYQEFWIDPQDPFKQGFLLR